MRVKSTKGMSSQPDIKTLAGAESGRDIVILGNGPSLPEMNFKKLSDPVYIGLNGSVLISNEKDIKEKYYVLSDLRFVKDKSKLSILKDNLNGDTKIIVRKELLNYLSGELINDLYSVRSLGRDGFSEDVKKGFYFGCTTVMLALQLAHYLGGGRVFLCGVDLRYDPVKPRFYKEDNVHGVDNFSCVQIHNIRESFKLLQENGVALFNCSPNSLLKPYVPYYELS
ncbi:6-hydroxymethylpterin diphosphokinase MptE-like protein [Bermanella sp. R86510]|uniref:6-hydroxymethylpterin diphosphokinase MptE-like protein n=1 Tax=unclassified Bermanella TaxID=2627862 RepID=UPI0037CA0959